MIFPSPSSFFLCKMLWVCFFCVQGKNQQRLFKHIMNPEETQMANKHMKRFSILPVIREMEIKITIRYHLWLIRLTIIKKCGNYQYGGRGWVNRLSHTMLWGWELTEILGEGAQPHQGNCVRHRPCSPSIQFLSL